jgi:uncharacterized protein YqjF (DUF2071 family)
LDLLDKRAFVSLVAFTMRGMRPRLGGQLGAWFFKPVATHEFLNARTYVRHGNERGIYFITEWLSSRLSVRLGPLFYGLPYRFAKIHYDHAYAETPLRGEVKDREGKQFLYEAQLSFEGGFSHCENDSDDEFLLERYTAFTSRNCIRRFFRVWHPPWRQARARISILDDSLVTKTFPWFAGAILSGANYSPGFDEVWMGRAHRVK